MEPERPHLRIEELEVVYGGLLQMPLIRLISLDSGVPDLLFQSLAAFEPAIQNTGYAASWHNLSDAYFELKLFDGNGLLRLWPTGTEIRLQRNAPSLRHLSLEDLARRISELITTATTTLESVDQRVSFATHSLILSLHARLTGRTVLEFLRAYVKEPPNGLGGLAEIGIRYTFQSADERIASWVFAEPSTSIRPNGVFMTLGVVFNGATTPASTVVDSARRYFESLASSRALPVEVLYDSATFA